MTVTSTATRVSYAGNGVTTAFVATSIKVWATSDLRVYLKDNTTLVETLQTLTTHYTVSGTLPGVPTVNFVAAPATGKTVIIERWVPNTQELDLIASGTFAAENVETQLDKTVAMVQDLARELDDFPATASEVFYATDYGVVADGVTEDHVALQAAIAACVAAGGGTVMLPRGTILIGATVTLYSLVVLKGVSRFATVIKAKASLNADMLKTLNYATLTGQNKYLIADGVQYGFGLEDLRLDGNKANNTSGNGLVCYGKRYHLRGVIIVDVKDIGWVSEAWYAVNTATHPEQPESLYEDVDVQNCGSHGVQYRGPTDAHFQSVFSHQNGGWGMRFESDGSTYSGSCDLHFAHIYANTSGGVFMSSQLRMRVGHLATESNFGVGLEDQSFATSYDFLESYINARTTGSYAILLSGSDITIGRIYHFDGGEDVGGVLSSGSRNSIMGGEIAGSASTKIGLLASGDHCHFACLISGYSGVGGVGVQFAATLRNSFIDLRLRDNKQGYNCAGTGLRNTGRISIEALATQTLVGTDFASGEAIDVVTLDAAAASVAQRLFPLGSASVPGLAVAGDRNTGVFGAAADTLAFAAGGTEFLRSTNALVTLALNTVVQKASANYSVRATSGDATHFVAAVAGNAATIRCAHWTGSATLDRWLVGKDNSAESGSDAGSNLACYAYNDAGGFLFEVFNIQRSSGVMRFNRELRVAGDIGGQASHNTITGTSDLTANSTGVGTILFKGTTNRNSTGFIKIYVGTTAYYIPVFSAITG